MDGGVADHLNGRAGEGTPVLDLDGYSGPLAQLLVLARAHEIDLTRLPLVALVAAGSPRWTAAARLQAVIVTAAMDEATRSAWCREQGLFPAELDAWKRDAIAGLGEPRAASAVEARQDRRRVKELERELHRKDKALAETAALLVLSKKLAAVFHQGEDA